MTTTKATFHVPAPLWDAFSKQTDDLFLKRGPFLDSVIAGELQHLADDLEGLKLSKRANRWIFEQLHRCKSPTGHKMDVKPVSIALAKKTTDDLNEAVRRHHLVRDAFLCRLLILLRATDALLRWLNVPGNTGRMTPFSTSPMKAIEEVRDDPLFYLREAVHREWSVGLYRVEFPEQLVWATCFIEDSYIPETGAYKNREKASREMEELFDEDSLLFSGASKPVRAVRRGE
jgi:hypothetical protein